MRYILTMMVLFFCGYTPVCTTSYCATPAYAEEGDWEPEDDAEEEETEDGDDT